MSRLLRFQNGVNAPAEKYGRGVKFVSVSDIIQNDYVTYDNIVGSVDIDDATLERYSVENGDMVFQRSSETVEDIGRANVYLDNRMATFGGFVIRGKKIGEYNPYTSSVCCTVTRLDARSYGQARAHSTTISAKRRCPRFTFIFRRWPNNAESPICCFL